MVWMRNLRCLLLVFLLSGLTGFGQSIQDLELDRYVAKVLETFEVPGLSLAVVKGGQVLTVEGFGVKTLGTGDDVDSQTLFGIASNTKAFTATALGILVEEGKLEWDGAVINYLPAFQMWDPYVTREMTIRDLLVHRSGLGLGAGDLLWWPPSTYNRKEIFSRLRFIKPATSFRSAYAYDNVLYLVAGEVIEAVSGQSWEDFVSERVLERVGMRGSNVRHSAAEEGGNLATPHARVEGVVRPVKPFGSDNTNPAGGINSNAEDMAKWMLVQLAEGVLPDGTRLFSAETSRELWNLVTPIPIAKPPEELSALEPSFNGYALGFRVLDYRGQKVVTHTGGLPGYVSRVTLLPQLRLGVAVLTNQESSAAFEAVTYRILDHFLGVEETDWVAAYERVTRRRVDGYAQSLRELEEARNQDSEPSLALSSYAGTYRDAWYGDVVISLQEGGLEIRFAHTPSLTGKLEHWQYDTFIARWTDRELRADAFVTFDLTPEGRVERARMKAVSPATDFSFDFHHLELIRTR